MELPEDSGFDCYELDNGNHVCSSNTSTLQDGYMVFSKFEHDAVATAKEVIEKAIEEPVVEDFREMVVKTPESLPLVPEADPIFTGEVTIEPS